MNDEDAWAWGCFGRLLGLVVGVVTFIGCWVYAVQSWGWFLGLAFGWFPAAIIGGMAGLLAWVLAPLVVLVLLGILGVIGFLWLSQQH